MAISSFMGLETALRGLLAQQRAIDVTGHNVANANTEGYSRQQAVLGASTPLKIPAGQEYNQIVSPSGDVAAYAKEIGQLNGAISGAVATGQTPNDLIDKRDLLLDKLSELGRVSVNVGANNAIDVSFGDQTPQ